MGGAVIVLYQNLIAPSTTRVLVAVFSFAVQFIFNVKPYVVVVGSLVVGIVLVVGGGVERF
jgi:hypothetical protein